MRFDYAKTRYSSMRAVVENCGEPAIQTDATIQGALLAIDIAEAAIEQRARILERDLYSDED